MAVAETQTNYHSTLRQIAKERRFQAHCELGTWDEKRMRYSAHARIDRFIVPPGVNLIR
jgi:hypothetical protein